MKKALINIFAAAFFAALLFAAPEIVPPTDNADAARVFVVVIDPAHGGGDWGVSMGGNYEKTFNLKTAKIIKKKLETAAPELKVYLTRDTDEFKGTEERAGFANSVKADMYISLHCDFIATGVPGAKVYCAAPSGASAEEPVEWPAAQGLHSAESKKIAKFISQYMQEALIPEGKAVIKEEASDSIPFASRGIEEARLYPLEGVNAPAVVVEMADMVSSEDLTNLKNDKVLAGLAYHIKEGILNYIKNKSLSAEKK